MNALLLGKFALITGASRGIGREIAIKLAAHGANVAITFRTSDSQALEVKAIINSMGRECKLLRSDSSNRIDVSKAALELDLSWGKLDILVNNAGINKPTDFDMILDHDWDEILSVNLKGPFICSQVFLPLLERSNNASIINIGSVSGQYGGPRTAHYAASKAGLISLSQVIARFGAKKGIRSNTIAAGLIESDMSRASLLSGTVNAAAKNILLERLGTPEDVADACIFLSSDMSKYITGQTINVNGGLYF